MDPQRSGQDVLRCHICKTPAPHLICGICHLHLCKACVGEHILDDPTEHKVVPFNKRESATKCPKHSKKVCEHHCKECDISICATCVSSAEHRSHELVEISKHFETQKERIQKDLEELEKFIYPAYQNTASNIPVQKDVLHENSKDLTKAIIEHGENLHGKIENVVQKLKSFVSDFNSKHLAILNKKEIEITCTISEVTHMIDDMKKILNSNEFSLVSAYKSRNDELRRLPPNKTLALPSFTPPKIKNEQIFQHFDFFSGLPLNKDEIDHRPVASKIESSLPEKRLIDAPRITKHMITDYEDINAIRSVSCLNDEYI